MKKTHWSVIRARKSRSLGFGATARSAIVTAIGAAVVGLTLATSSPAIMQKPPTPPAVTKVIAAADDVKAPEVKPGDAQDVIFMGDHRPVKMRFHLQVDGEPFLPRWQTYVNGLFDELDADSNGILSMEEAKPAIAGVEKANATGVWRASGGGDVKLLKDAMELLEAGKMDKEQFEVAMRKAFSPLVTGGSMSSNQRGNDKLISALDTDGDKMLSPEEIAASRTTLLLLDANDDEIVASSELMGGSQSNTFVVGGGAPQQFDKNLPRRMIAVFPGEAEQIAHEMVERYDSGDNPDGKVSSEEIALGDGFAAHDKDADGTLDLTELAAYIESDRPDLELVANLGGQAPNQMFSFGEPPEDEDEDADSDEEKDGTATFQSSQIGGIKLSDLPEKAQAALKDAIAKAKQDGKPLNFDDLPEDVREMIKSAGQKQDDDADQDDEEEKEEANVNVRVDADMLRNPPTSRVWNLVASENHDPSLNAKVEETESGLVIDLERFRLEFTGASMSGVNFSIARLEEQQFSAFDMDNNKYLDETEAGRFGAGFNRMDANGDGMVFLEEFKGYLQKQKAAAESQLIATAEDHGYQLFKVLDVDSNNQLSLREIYYAAKRLREADLDGDGALALTEIPHSYQLKLSKGQSGSIGAFAVVAFAGQQSSTQKPKVGPEWFQKMDKNADGDVSRREFLGGAEDFQRLDTDRDELIDPKEAKAATQDN